MCVDWGDLGEKARSRVGKEREREWKKGIQGKNQYPSRDARVSASCSRRLDHLKVVGGILRLEVGVNCLWHLSASLAPSVRGCWHEVFLHQPGTFASFISTEKSDKSQQAPSSARHNTALRKNVDTPMR